jgi:hypothetical protein
MDKNRILLPGINRVVEQEGSRYLVECEDRGTSEGAFEVRVVRDGSQLWSRRFPYQDLLERELPETELEHELAGRAEKTIQTVQAAIARGKLGG